MRHFKYYCLLIDTLFAVAGNLLHCIFFRMQSSISSSMLQILTKLQIHYNVLPNTVLLMRWTLWNSYNLYCKRNSQKIFYFSWQKNWPTATDQCQCQTDCWHDVMTDQWKQTTQSLLYVPGTQWATMFLWKIKKV